MNFKDEEVLAGWEDILARKYQLKITELADGYPDKRSIYVSYGDIDEYDPDMAMFITDRPDKCLSLGRKAIKNLMPPAWDQTGNINLRITGLPRDARVDIRNLRSKHLGKLVAIEGLVRKATTVRPKMTKALFRCARCGAEQWVNQSGMFIREPIACTSVDGGCNKTAAQFVLINERCTHIDTQKIEIQESPEGLRGGAQPERISGYLEDDITGATFPGNRVILNGIIRPVQKGERDKSSIFETFIEVHSMDVEQHEYDEIPITEEDEQEILKMSRDPEFLEKTVRSIAPTIYGHEMIKEAIALQLFGGTPKKLDDKTVLRGDIHILLVGDPGVAKSQLLRYMSDLAPRGIFASGRSASAAGLCVHGDTMIRTGTGNVTIKEFVESRMDDPEDYKEGIQRQAVSGDMVMSVTETGFPAGLPVSYIWRIKTPSFLVETVTEKGNRLILTPETKIMARNGMVFDWVEASELRTGMMVMAAGEDKMMMHTPEIKEVRKITEDLPEYVYDLTVEPSHSFLGNGFVIHNTAAAVKDDFGEGRWTLEAGALVLADKGLACIDELDKMGEQDKSALHEAMESQKISIAKAGITATLQCRCSMLAAANPKRGRFETGEIVPQIDLLPTLMSRFDMIFVIRDIPKKEDDRRVAEHILKAHRRGQVLKGNISDERKGRGEKILEDTESIKPVYEPDILRKYVAYSKRIVPVISDDAFNAIEDNYLKIRGTGGGESRTVPITARQLEAYIRLSEASARARLSDTVTKEDAERSIKIIHYYLDKTIGTDAGGGKTVWDIDKVATGVSATVRDEMHIVMEAIREYENERGMGITKGELIGKLAGQVNEIEITVILDKLQSKGELYCPSIDVYKVG